jgi:hypothetical protein
MENILTKDLRTKLSKKRERLNRFYFRNYLNSSSKGLVILFAIAWVIVSLLHLLAIDFSGEPDLSRRNFFNLFLYIGFSFSVVRMYVAYYRKNKKG